MAPSARLKTKRPSMPAALAATPGATPNTPDGEHDGDDGGQGDADRRVAAAPSSGSRVRAAQAIALVPRPTDSPRASDAPHERDAAGAARGRPGGGGWW